MTVHFTISPDIDSKLAVWYKWVQAQTEKKQAAGPCITISRKFGCQAYPIAKVLEKRLNERGNPEEPWIVLDRELLQKIAEESGISQVNNKEKMNPLFHSLVSKFRGKSYIEPFEVYSYIKEAVQYFAKSGNSIIIGRGGAIFAHDFPNCIHIRLIAPLEFRIKKIMNTLNMDEIQARKHVEKGQNERDEFIFSFDQTSLEDPALFHLILNNAQYTPEQIGRIIEYQIDLLRGD